MTSNPSYTLDKVAAEAEQDALAEIEAGRKETDERLRVIVQETNAEASKIIETSHRQAESVKRQVLGAADLEARNSTLRTLEDASNQVFQAALESVATTSGRSEKALEKLVKEGLAVIGKEAIVECTAKEKRAVASIIKELNSKEGAKLTLSEKELRSAGGVVLHSKDMAVRFDNTFEARLERMKAELRRSIANILMGEAP